MTWLARHVLGFILGGLLAYYGTPLFRRAALAINLVDRPDGRLKNQAEAVPYLGGLAIYLAFLMAISLAYEFSPEVLAMLLAGTIVLLLGLIDDFGVLTPRAKLFGQAIAVFVLMRAGIRINLVFLPEWVDIPLTVLWLIGVTNAVNLSDIMDGLAGGLSFIACVMLFVVNHQNGDHATALLTASLAGSILGFLRFNVRPARIYLGDSGSLFLGLMIGAVAMIGRYTERSPAGAVAPVLILAVPVFDTLFVMAMRWRRGIPVFLGSKDHFPLRLRRKGLSVPMTVGTAWGAAVVLGLAGLAVMHLPFAWAAALAGGALAFLLAGAIWLASIDMER